MRGRVPAAAWYALAWLLLLLPAIHAQKPAPKPKDADCLACHGDPGLSKEVAGKQISLAVNEARFKTSVHGSLGLGCADCHTDAQAPHGTPLKKVECGSCHAEEQQKYANSIHAAGLRLGKGGATCLECHGDAHEIAAASDPASRVHHANVAATCARCHAVQFTMERSGLSAQPVALYKESVHGKAVAAGNVKAAACTDCHDSHEVLPAGNPKSRIFKFNVPQTCGRCHQDVSQEFMSSIHGQALQRGNWQAPVCTDCHGIHSIKEHIDPASSVAAQNLARTACARCHESVRLSQELGVPDRRVSTYLDSYHGLASQLDSKVVANCASCHGVHNILPSSDPKSMVNKNNLVTTCGKCHPGASQNFAQAQVHIGVPLSRDMGSVGTLWVRRFYLLLIVVTIGGMLLHNAIVWGAKVRWKRRALGPSVERMSRVQRLQHWTLLSSFLFLALTGFALKYPDSPLTWLLGSSEALRRYGHRVAAVVLLGVGVYHLFYLWRTREGRQVMRDFIPRMSDVREFTQNMLYHLGRSREHPHFGRFTYAEKAEYLAMVWGTALMGATGLMLWFKVEVGWLLPRWWVDIANAIHFYEAILAVLAIAVWHFYHVIFDPDVYPIDLAFWDGRVSEERYKEHHPRAYERMMEPEENEKEGPFDTEAKKKKKDSPGKEPEQW